MSTDKTVGILGGGQLGRMLAHPAALLSIPLLILDSGANTPAKQVILPPAGHSSHVDGPFTSREHILELASKVDVLTVEIEHVDADVLDEVERAGKVEVHPSPQTIKVIQDKYEQKRYLVEREVAVADFLPVERSATDPSVVERSIQQAARELGLPLMLKARTLAYDGQGNFVLKETDAAAIGRALDFLGDRPLYAERWAPFDREIAVMVVRTPTGEVASYDPVETVHEDSILRLVLCPLRAGGKDVNIRAKQLAEKAVSCLHGAGIFGVEMFLMPDNSLLINEIAPRPHNSGHHTIEACHTSQFENHLRAITSLPLGSTALKVPATAMINLIGLSSSMDALKACVATALAVEGASVHMYGKAECRAGRKMGHITVTADSDAELIERVRPILAASLPSSSKLPAKYCPPAPASGLSSTSPLVGIIMGSDSDLPTMAAAAQMLELFKVPYELTIVSAHRTPDRMVTYAREAASRGLRCIIAGAGGAAHLPGMVAAMTALPVVGVPVKGSVLDGVDSLHSIVQMPRGIPVATVAIGNSTNAGLLAVRIVSASVPHLVQDMEKYLASLETEVQGKADRLESIGWTSYLEGMKK